MAEEVTKRIVACFFIISGLIWPGAFGFRTTTEDPADAGEIATAIAFTGAVYIIPLVVFVICAGGFSLLSFIVCWCKNRNKPNVTIGPTDAIHPPNWVKTIQPHPSLVGSGFASCSDGLFIISPTQVKNCRQISAEADGARWSQGLTFGKHVFEIEWPKAMRGPYASIGVGSGMAPLNTRPNKTLVGMTTHSHGLDISRRRVIHNDMVKRTCPPVREEFVPDKFFMYVDCDSGKVGWGSENRYWGVQVSQIARNLYPLYVIVGIGCPGAVVTVKYMGTAVDSPFSGSTSGPPYPAPQYSLYPEEGGSGEKQPIPGPPSYTVPASPPPTYREMSPPPTYSETEQQNQNN